MSKLLEKIYLSRKKEPAEKLFRAIRVDGMYRIDGKRLREVLSELGVSQIVFGEKCGYKGGSRICHIIRAGKHNISGESLRPILAALKHFGGKISITDSI